MSDQYAQQPSTGEWFLNQPQQQQPNPMHRNPSYPAMVHPALGDSSLHGFPHTQHQHHSHHQIPHNSSSNSVLVQELPAFPLPVNGYIGADSSQLMMPMGAPIPMLHIPEDGMMVPHHELANMPNTMQAEMESFEFHAALSQQSQQQQQQQQQRPPQGKKSTSSRKSSVSNNDQFDSLAIATNVLGKHGVQHDSNDSSQNDLFALADAQSPKSPKKRHRNGDTARLNRKKKQENFELVQAQTGKMVNTCDLLLRNARRLEDEIAHWRTIVQHQQKAKA